MKGNFPAIRPKSGLSGQDNIADIAARFGVADIPDPPLVKVAPW